MVLVASDFTVRRCIPFSIRCLSLWRQLCARPAIVISMLTISDLGRGIAKFLVELPHHVRQGVVRGVELVERAILTVGRPPAGMLVHPAVQLGSDPRIVPLPAARIEGSSAGIDPHPMQQPSAFVLHALVQGCTARFTLVLPRDPLATRADRCRAGP